MMRLTAVSSGFPSRAPRNPLPSLVKAAENMQSGGLLVRLGLSTGASQRLRVPWISKSLPGTSTPLSRHCSWLFVNAAEIKPSPLAANLSAVADFLSRFEIRITTVHLHFGSQPSSFSKSQTFRR